MFKNSLFKGISILRFLQARLGDGSLFLGEMPVFFGKIYRYVKAAIGFAEAKNKFLQFKGKICINKLNSFIFIPILTTRNKKLNNGRF